MATIVSMSIDGLFKTAAVSREQAAGLVSRLYDAGLDVSSPANLVNVLKILAGDGGQHAQEALEVSQNPLPVLQLIIDDAFGYKQLSDKDRETENNRRRDKDLATVNQNNLLTNLFELPSKVVPSVLAEGRMHLAPQAVELLNGADDETKENLLRKSAWFALMSRMPVDKLGAQWAELMSPLQSQLRYDPETALKMPLVESAIDETAAVIAPTFFGKDPNAVDKARKALESIFSGYYLDSFPGLSKSDIDGSGGRAIEPAFFRSELDFLDKFDLSTQPDQAADPKSKKKPKGRGLPETRPPVGPKMSNHWVDLYLRYDDFMQSPERRNYEALQREESSGYMARNTTGGLSDVVGGLILKNTAGDSPQQGMVVGYKPEYAGRKLVVVRKATGGYADWDITSPNVVIADTQVSPEARAEFK